MLCPPLLLSAWAWGLALLGTQSLAFPISVRNCQLLLFLGGVCNCLFCNSLLGSLSCAPFTRGLDHRQAPEMSIVKSPT